MKVAEKIVTDMKMKEDKDMEADKKKKETDKMEADKKKKEAEMQAALLIPQTPSDLRGRWKLDGKLVILTPAGTIEDPDLPKSAIGYWKPENVNTKPYSYTITWISGRAGTYCRASRASVRSLKEK